MEHAQPAMTGQRQARASPVTWLRPCPRHCPLACSQCKTTLAKAPTAAGILIVAPAGWSQTLETLRMQALARQQNRNAEHTINAHPLRMTAMPEPLLGYAETLSSTRPGTQSKSLSHKWCRRLSQPALSCKHKSRPGPAESRHKEVWARIMHAPCIPCACHARLHVQPEHKDSDSNATTRRA